MWAKRKSGRSGLRIRGGRGHPVVRKSLIRYAAWLRAHHEFPVRLVVYLLPSRSFSTTEGQSAVISFFAPFDPRHEPYARIATGDYPAESTKFGRDNALATYIHALGRQIVHYQQWLESGSTHNRGVDRKASAMLRRYNRVTARP
jgi:hypothetical protein